MFLARPAHMAATDKEVREDWLGGEHDGVSLSDALQDMLEKGAAGDVWTMRDVPEEEDGTLAVKKKKAMWKAIVADCAMVAKKDKLNTHWVRFEEWWDAQYPPEEEEDESLGVTHKPASEAEKRDLDAQGMKLPIELRTFELAAFLGRPVAKGETDGGEYGGPPTAMKGGGKAKKYGDVTFPVALAACRTQRSIQPVETFFDRLTRLLIDKADEQSTRDASRILRMWTTVKATLKKPAAIVAYLEEDSQLTMGRGIPQLYDPQVGMRSFSAEWGGDSASQSFGSGRDSARDAEQPDALTSLNATVKELARQNQRLVGQMETMTAKMDKLKAAPPLGGGVQRFVKGQCFNCGSTDHRVADCPLPLREGVTVPKAGE